MKNRLKVNTYTSLLNQIIVILTGFILPKLYLTYFGSQVNGLVSSINQFIVFISFMEFGIGTVVQSSLYAPLANHDEDKVSMIIKSAKTYFKKIIFFFSVYLFFLLLIYPTLVDGTFDRFYTVSLIIILSINLYAQYYFGLVNQIILTADQRSYIVNIANILCVLLNTVICTILIVWFQFDLPWAKLVSALILLCKPIFLNCYVKKVYKINKNITYTEEPIKQKWYGLAQHLSAVVLSNTDTIVLTLFSTLLNVSIYSVYFMVVNGINNIIMSLTSDYQSLMGMCIATNDIRRLREVFEKFEFLMHSIITMLYTCSCILIVPFVLLYTSGIDDVNYRQSSFAFILILGQALFCFRTAYYCVIKAVGHYKETQLSAIVEMILNIIISIIVVFNYGLIGVAVGTLVATLYRTIYCVYYASKTVLGRDVRLFWKQITLDAVVLGTVYIGMKVLNVQVNNFVSWVGYSIFVIAVTLIVFIIVNYTLNKKRLMSLIKKG